MNITRRTAMQAIGSLLVAPCVKLRQEIDREALLRQFCLHERERFKHYDLSSPFETNGLTYATDSRYAVRTRLESPQHDGEREIPPLESIFTATFKPRGLQQFILPHPDSRFLRQHKDNGSGHCPECGNRRVYLNEYPGNDWLTGPEACDLDYDIDDNSHRDPACQRCHGLAYYGPSILDVCGVPMDYWRLKAIAALPDVMVCKSPSLIEDQQCILFAADGFDGIAMGMNA